MTKFIITKEVDFNIICYLTKKCNLIGFINSGTLETEPPFVFESLQEAEDFARGYSYKEELENYKIIEVIEYRIYKIKE